MIKKITALLVPILTVLASQAAFAEVSNYEIRLPSGADTVTTVAEAAPSTPGYTDAESVAAWTQFLSDKGKDINTAATSGFSISSQAMGNTASGQVYATGSGLLPNETIPSSLSATGGTLALSGNTLTHVDSLSGLSSVGADLMLHANPLTNVDGLINLTTIVGNLHLYQNSGTLTNLDGLANLTSANLLIFDGAYAGTKLAASTPFCTNIPASKYFGLSSPGAFAVKSQICL